MSQCKRALEKANFHYLDMQ